MGIMNRSVEVTFVVRSNEACRDLHPTAPSEEINRLRTKQAPLVPEVVP